MERFGGDVSPHTHELPENAADLQYMVVGFNASQHILQAYSHFPTAWFSTLLFLQSVFFLESVILMQRLFYSLTIVQAPYSQT